MRRVTKLFLLLGILYSSLFASIDEYKSDLYYANGIMINISEKEATKIWNQKVKELFADKQDSYKNLEKIQNSYNRSQGFFDDLFESMEQKTSNEFGWEQLTAYVTAFLTLHNIQEDWNAHIDDLTKQVASYKQSIKDGHGVIVIAHSQGNYFTNEAYEKLDDWMKDYFHMFGVATPANHVAGFAVGDTTAPYVLFDNDFINGVIGGLNSNREDVHHGGFPNYFAHNFYESYLTDETTKNDIVTFIDTKIQEQIDAQSQWATNEESDENTKDYRITVKHIYDANIVMAEKVYPFASNKKLYQVQDPLYPEDKEKKVYVKASFGGERILNDSEWEAEKNQFYKLEGTDPVEYIEGEDSCKDPSIFEVISQQNENTADWRVTVKNKETDEITEGVYPFNLNGSLYELESGEWVLASCGGMEILVSWDERKENEAYILEGVNEKIYYDQHIDYSSWSSTNIYENPNDSQEFTLSLDGIDDVRDNYTHAYIGIGDDYTAIPLVQYRMKNENGDYVWIEGSCPKSKRSFWSIVSSYGWAKGSFTVEGTEGPDGGPGEADYYVSWGYLLLPSEKISDIKTIEYRWKASWSEWGCGTEMADFFVHKQSRVKTTTYK